MLSCEQEHHCNSFCCTSVMMTVITTMTKVTNMLWLMLLVPMVTMMMVVMMLTMTAQMQHRLPWLLQSCLFSVS